MFVHVCISYVNVLLYHFMKDAFVNRKVPIAPGTRTQTRDGDHALSICAKLHHEIRESPMLETFKSKL